MGVLTHLNLASFLLFIDKECIPRSDATERSVWPGSALFAYKMHFWNLNEIETYYPTALKLEKNRLNDRAEKFQRHKWAKEAFFAYGISTNI